MSTLKTVRRLVGVDGSCAVCLGVENGLVGGLLCVVQARAQRKGAKVRFEVKVQFRVLYHHILLYVSLSFGSATYDFLS
jgi:hypothetical protein